MGLCPSRQKSVKTVQVKTTLKSAQQETTPKTTQPQKAKVYKWADAEPFVPQVVPDKDAGPKQPWEQYLDAKVNRKIAIRSLGRGTDGKFTSEYRRLLGANQQAPTTYKKLSQTTADLARVYRDKPRDVGGETKRKQTSLKKAILAGRSAHPLEEKFEQFDAILRRLDMRAANDPKILPSLAPEVPRYKDDSSNQSRMPFGMTDRCYLSDSEDTGSIIKRAGNASRHSMGTHAPIREYVTQTITPEVESALTALLFRLRQLRDQEMGVGMKSKRYSVGFREAGRVITNGNCKGVVFAPDVDRTKTGALEEKMTRLINECKSKGIPVFFGLSRRQLGFAIQKNVAVSVLAVEDVRGAVGEFERLRSASEAGAVQ